MFTNKILNAIDYIKQNKIEDSSNHLEASSDSN